MLLLAEAETKKKQHTYFTQSSHCDNVSPMSTARNQQKNSQWHREKTATQNLANTAGAGAGAKQMGGRCCSLGGVVLCGGANSEQSHQRQPIARATSTMLGQHRRFRCML